MLRRGTIVVGSLVALLIFAAPGWTQFRGRGPSMGSMSFSHSPAFVGSSRGFPAFGTGTALSSRGFPATGTGTFNSTSRNAFLSSAGRVVPTANGLAVVSANGTLMPAGTGMVSPTFRSVNPASFVSPLANTAITQSAYAHTLRHFEREQEWASGFNPYLYGGFGFGFAGYGYGFGYGGYGYGNPYAAYGVPYYGSSASYGAGAPTVGAANNTYAPAAAPNSTTSTAQTKPSDALKAFGIPVEFGEVKWPLALRLMPPDSKRDLLDKLESQMKIAANQAINGNASQTLLRETKNTLDSVKWWLRGRRSSMADNTYQDGDAFLRQLEESLRRMDS
jgi:hypothetical protein